MLLHAETDRLIFRDITMEDTEGLFLLDSDPEVHRYLGNQPVTDRQQIVNVIHMIHQQYIENGIGRCAVIEKKSNEFIGWAGLKLVKEETNGHINFYDLGYRLRRKFWGMGIGTECAAISLQHGFINMDLPILFASAHIDNKGSNKILQNAGFRFVETFLYEDDTDNWYELKKEEWLKTNDKGVTNFNNG